MKKQHTPMPVVKWDKESLMQVMYDNYFRILTKIRDNKKWSCKTKEKKAISAWANFMSMYEPVLNDRVKYKKL